MYEGTVEKKRACAVVLGGNGFIGSHLVDKLIDEDWTVSVIDPFPERYRKPSRAVNYYREKKFGSDSLDALLAETNYVFHMVNSGDPRQSNKNVVEDVRANLISNLDFFHKIATKSNAKIVFLSSGGAVYGEPRYLPIREDHVTDPLSAYGIHKLALEKYLHLFSTIYGLKYTVLRVANPVGRRQNPDGTQGVVSVFLGRVARSQAVEIWGTGNAMRDYVDVRDVADACFAAAVFDTDHTVFNIGSGIGASLNEILDQIERVVGGPVLREYNGSRHSDPTSIVLDIGRASRDLNWIPQRKLIDSIADTWEFVRGLYDL